MDWLHKETVALRKRGRKNSTGQQLKIAAAAVPSQQASLLRTSLMFALLAQNTLNRLLKTTNERYNSYCLCFVLLLLFSEWRCSTVSSMSDSSGRTVMCLSVCDMGKVCQNRDFHLCSGNVPTDDDGFGGGQVDCCFCWTELYFTRQTKEAMQMCVYVSVQIRKGDHSIRAKLECTGQRVVVVWINHYRLVGDPARLNSICPAALLGNDRVTWLDWAGK